MWSDAVLDMDHAAFLSDIGSNNISIHFGIAVGETSEVSNNIAHLL